MFFQPLVICEINLGFRFTFTC